MIEVQSLTKKYRSLYAVKNVSFAVKQGEVIGFLGPNGAGKTTTMKMITCYLPPSSGNAVVAGFGIHESQHDIKRMIGYLPESTPLYPEMSANSYLHFIARARGLRKKDLAVRMDYVVKAAGLKKVLFKDISELSKGFRQRLCLAQALLHDPPILILDEPTTGLDPLQRIEIRDLIREIGKTKTVILSTHILSEAEATCNRMIVINLGTVVGDGTAEQLVMQHGKKSRFKLLLRADRPVVERVLEDAGFVREFRCEGRTEEGLWTFEVTPDTPGTAGGEKLYNLIREKGWGLAEMSYLRTTLEDVFRKLTESSIAATPPQTSPETKEVA